MVSSTIRYGKCAMQPINRSEKPDTLFVVRLYDGFDNQWIDISRPVSKEEADKILAEKTHNGTTQTKYSDIDYYAIFPANTQMIYSNGFGERP